MCGCRTLQISVLLYFSLPWHRIYAISSKRKQNNKPADLKNKPNKSNVWQRNASQGTDFCQLSRALPWRNFDFSLLPTLAKIIYSFPNDSKQVNSPLAFHIPAIRHVTPLLFDGIYNPSMGQEKMTRLYCHSIMTFIFFCRGSGVTAGSSTQQNKLFIHFILEDFLWKPSIVASRKLKLPYWLLRRAFPTMIGIWRTPSCVVWISHLPLSNP